MHMYEKFLYVYIHILNLIQDRETFTISKFMETLFLAIHIEIIFGSVDDTHALLLYTSKLCFQEGQSSQFSPLWVRI